MGVAMFLGMGLTSGASGYHEISASVQPYMQVYTAKHPKVTPWHGPTCCFACSPGDQPPTPLPTGVVPWG